MPAGIVCQLGEFAGWESLPAGRVRRKSEFSHFQKVEKSTETDRESLRLARQFDENDGTGAKDFLVTSNPRSDVTIEVKNANNYQKIIFFIFYIFFKTTIPTQMQNIYKTLK